MNVSSLLGRNLLSYNNAAKPEACRETLPLAVMKRFGCHETLRHLSAYQLLTLQLRSLSLHTHLPPDTHLHRSPMSVQHPYMRSQHTCNYTSNCYLCFHSACFPHALSLSLCGCVFVCLSLYYSLSLCRVAPRFYNWGPRTPARPRRIARGSAKKTGVRGASPRAPRKYWDFFFF